MRLVLARIVFRIGINLGDIIIDGDDIFGDGVNIAARLEAHCEGKRAERRSLSRPLRIAGCLPWVHARLLSVR